MMNADEPLRFSDEVQAAIEQIVERKDALDDGDFDVLRFVNELFPNDVSLRNIEQVIDRYENDLKSIEDELSQTILDQAHEELNDSKDVCLVLSDIENEIQQLLCSIQSTEQKATHSEQSVSEITGDIKKMDCAKRNLTMAITTLNQLEILVNGIETIKLLVAKKQYGEVLRPLEGILLVVQSFEQYKHDIEEIGVKSQEIHEILADLSQQILGDFRDIFEKNVHTSIPFKQLADSCKILDLVSAEVKQNLIEWFLTYQLSEYAHLFNETESIAWLDSVEKRFAWFKKHLLQFEEKLGAIFPSSWHMSELISVRFCEMTATSLGKLMNIRRNEIDVKLLLNSLQKSENFEILLNKRFVTNRFVFMIQQCFQPFLYIFLHSLDSDLAQMIDNCARLERENVFARTETTDTAKVLATCPDLFLSYKKGLVQCAQLDTNEQMLKLMAIFRKYLHAYCTRILLANLPNKKNTGATPVAGSAVAGAVPITAAVAAAAAAADDTSSMTSANLIFLQNFSKSLGVSSLTGSTLPTAKLSRLEVWKICSILLTAEYSLETVQQLQEKFTELIDEQARDLVSFQHESEQFRFVIEQCLTYMKCELESLCDHSLHQMTKINWNGLHSVGDQSGYVSDIFQTLKSLVPLIRQNLNTSRVYFVQFCTKFANSFIAKFVQTIYKCKPMSTVGAEQLLLDTHMIKGVLGSLPSLELDETRKAPSAYSKIVMKGMTRAEMILKIVLAPAEPYAEFVTQVRKLLPDMHRNEFQKILDMKNIRKTDQSNLIEMFVNQSPHDQQSIVGSNNGKISKLEKIIKKYL